MDKDDNSVAVERFDGKKAVGQTITVEEIKPLNVLAAPRTRGTRNGRTERGGRNFRSRKPTVEELDAELNRYMNNDEISTDKPSRKSSTASRKPKPTAEDLDKELEAYMNNKPFPATGSD